MIFKAYSIGFLALMFALPFNGKASEYTMADLEALESDKNVLEYFKHAKDIRPSLRQEAWKKMTLSMADIYAQELLKAKSISNKQFSDFSSISAWPVLSQDEFFAQKRNKVALAYFTQCLEINGSKCVSKMEKLYLDYGADPVLGYELAKIASSIKGDSPNLWPFLSPIASSAFGEFYCDKSPLYENLAIKLASKKTDMVHKDCLESFAARAQKEIKSSIDMKGKSLAYKALSILGLLSPEDQNQQSIYDALTGALHEKEHWSGALSALDYYGESKQSRERFINDLRKQDTLPDDLFSLKSSKQALALTKLFGKKFPELLDLYTNKCLNWLKGNGVFPAGNPTPNCHSYFEMARVVGSSPEGIIREYEKLVSSWSN